MISPAPFKKLALFSDIHFGRRSNSRVHNQDCLDYIRWFCAQVDSSYTHVAFLGDWFESRSAINIETMEYSYQGLQLLNDLGLPVYFCVGNHDLHRRTTRDVHSVRMFNEMSNFIVVDSVMTVDGMLFSPFLFEEEYVELLKHNHDCKAFFGHFEFKNFVLTGHSRVAEHGPDHKLFSGPKKIFSGHFHKRQQVDNVVYIGNVFPMDFGDAGDYERGMCTYYVDEDKVTFTNWSDCPKYYKTTLADVIADKWAPLPKMRVKCIINAELGYQEAQELRDAMIEAYQLRDFVLEEDREAKQGLLEGDNCKVEETLLDFGSIDELVISQLETVKEDKKAKIDGALLVEIYKGLVVENTEGEQA